MSKRGKARVGAAVAGATLLFGATTAGAAAPGTTVGPSTTVDPYVLPLDPSTTSITSLLTVDDLAAGNGYTMAGIPDGLGAYLGPDGNLVVLANHELGSTVGVTRSHGAAGAFVSQWTINPTTKAVIAGKDAMTTVDYAGTTPAAFNRFCSADLAQSPQLYNATTGKGYDGRLFLHGEEAGLEGRVVATDPTTGNAWVLPALGRTSWENALAANTAGSDTQLVIGMNDSSAANQTANLVYVGTKTATGTPVEKAGFTNGSLFTMKLTGGVTTDASFRTTYGVGNAQPFTLAAISGATGAALQASSVAAGGFQPDRTEDGAWDPSNPNDFYFLTTGSTAAAAGRGGLWRVRWNDRTQPQLGGTLTLLVNNPGSHAATDDSTNQPGFYMPDNLTIDTHGHILIQEDPGADNYVSRLFAYDIATNQLKPVATFDPARFGAGAPGFITNDEESSGIIDAESLLGPGSFLFDAQVHTATGLSNPTRDVERGQLLSMNIDFAKLFGGPTPVVPEAPASVLLSLGALATAGGYLVLRRRAATA